jgi:flagellar protein FlaJ
MRIVSSVIESHRFGGNLSDTFEALSNTSVEIDRLREERRLYMNSQMITGYIVFFVFLAVMIGLEKFLVPSLGGISTGTLLGAGAPASPSNLAEEYKTIFRNLILVQGFFAGLSVGKMAEGAMVAGLKHSIFMMFVGGLVFILAG